MQDVFMGFIDFKRVLIYIIRVIINIKYIAKIKRGILNEKRRKNFRKTRGTL